MTKKYTSTPSSSVPASPDGKGKVAKERLSDSDGAAVTEGVKNDDIYRDFEKLKADAEKISSSDLWKEGGYEKNEDEDGNFSNTLNTH